MQIEAYFRISHRGDRMLVFARLFGIENENLPYRAAWRVNKAKCSRHLSPKIVEHRANTTNLLRTAWQVAVRRCDDSTMIANMTDDKRCAVQENQGVERVLIGEQHAKSPWMFENTFSAIQNDRW